jgi:hypothetical protein
MRHDDYTRLPIGTKLDSGEIQKCPHCQRTGLLEVVDKKKWYTHSQFVGFDSKGSPVTNWDMCPKDTSLLETITPE